MIQLSLTKEKFKATIQLIHSIIASIRNNKSNLTNWNLAQANAHVFFLHELSIKMRSKLVLIEDKPGDHRLKYSINEMQALVIVTYKDIIKPDSPGMNPYCYSIFEEISTPIFQKLLS